MSPCLNDDQLEALADYSFNEMPDAAVADHLKNCTSCQERLKAFQADQDLAHSVRRALGRVPVENSTETVASDAIPVERAAPSIVGQYHLKRAIASGGMGTVYEAVQQSPRRTVAVKLMKKGIASRSALRRFTFESQILARLRHPGIAQVFEAGVHSDGEQSVPFFAMEYIPNARPITDFARNKELRMRDRLSMFAQVCDAVHHGHQKGVIHRDLKPSNILVDSSGQVKVIDFGVARTTDSDLAITTLQTDVGQLIGTLQYMSPEQCDADPHDIDTRSDVYALGVVLYELLCDKPPYDLKSASVYEAARVIREQSPARPSVINRTLRGDVETIALKALEKNRERRYRSAADLGEDIRRYLAGEAITARPPSMAYQVKVFARKHRVIVGAAATVFVVLSAALVATSILYRRADHARILAEQGQAQAKAVTDFLTETLSSIDPDKALGRQVTVRELADKTTADIEKSFSYQPLVEATIRVTLGKTYSALADYAEAETQLRRALELRLLHDGPSSLSVAEAQSYFGTLLRIKGDYEAARAAHQTALNIRTERLGDEHLDVAASMNDLGIVLRRQGHFQEAGLLLQKAVSIRKKMLGERHPLVAESLNNLGLVQRSLERFSDAEALLTEALAIWRSHHGNVHPDVATALSNLGEVKIERKDFAGAEPLLREAVEIARAVYAKDHNKLASSLSTFGSVLVGLGRLDEAETTLQESIGMYQRLFENLPSDAAKPLSHLAQVEFRRGENEKGLALLQQGFEIKRQSLRGDHPDVLRWASYLERELNRVARIHEERGDQAGAQGLRLQADALARFKPQPMDRPIAP